MREPNAGQECCQPEDNLVKARGEVWEGVAFSWVQSGGDSIAYYRAAIRPICVASHFWRDGYTFKKPLYIAALWAAVSWFLLWLLLRAARNP